MSSKKPTVPNVGLKQRIQSASSAAELDSLLKEGEGYKNASPGTRRSWQREATKRRAQLTTGRK